MEHGHDGIVLVGGVVVKDKVEIVLCLSLGGPDVVPVLIVGPEAAYGLAGPAVGGQLHGFGRVGLGVGVGMDLQIGLGAKLLVAAEQTVAVEPLGVFLAGGNGVCPLLGLLVQQDQCAVVVLVHDLDAAVLDQILAEGLNSQVDPAVGAGEAGEVVLVLRLADGHVLGLIVVAEDAAPDLDVGGVDELGLEAGGAGLGLVVVVEDLHAAGLGLTQLHGGFLVYGLAVHHLCGVTAVGLHHDLGGKLAAKLGADKVEDVGAAEALKGAAIDVGVTALHLAAVKGRHGAGVVDHLHHGVSGVGGGAVALKVASVGHEGGAVAHLDHGAEDVFDAEGVLVLAHHAGDLLAQVEDLAHHAHDAVLGHGGVDDVLPAVGQLGILVVLAGFLLVGPVLVAVGLAGLLLVHGFQGGILADRAVLGVLLGSVGAVLLAGGAGAVAAIVVIAGIFVIIVHVGGFFRYQQILVLGAGHVDARGVLGHADAQLHCRADGLPQLGPGEIALVEGPLVAGLKVAAVDHQVSFCHVKEIPGGVGVDFVFKGVHPPGGKGDQAGALAVFSLPSPGGGVDDGKGGPIQDSEGDAVVVHGLVPLGGIIVPVGVIADLDLMSVQVQNLIRSDLHGHPLRFP